MKFKVSILTASVLCVILIALDSFIYFTLYRHLIQLEAGVYSTKAQTIAQGFRHGDDLSDNVDGLRQYLQEGQAILVLSANGHILGSASDIPIPSSMPAFAPTAYAVQRTFEGGESLYMYTLLPANQRDPGRPQMYVLLLANIDNVREYMQTLATVLLVGSVGAVLLAALAGYLISAAAVRPINNMIRLVERIQANHLDERVDVPRGRDEIVRLALTFNSMLNRIQRSFEQQSRFVADASHEIRTPLTTIRGYAGLLRRWGKDDPEVLDRGIQVIEKESNRLHHLANDLLTLASLESTTSDLPKHADLKVAVDEVVDPLVMLHPELQLEKVYQHTSQADIAMPHLKQILTNLIDNAVKHTPAGGTVQVTTTEKLNRVFIEIRDTGKGIPKEDLPHIFERFYRVDKARSRREGGNGLGLAIVKELIDLYGGEIDVDSEPGVGTTIRLSLPARGSSESLGLGRPDSKHPLAEP